MTDTKLLLAKIKDSGLKLGFIAEKLGISRQTLSYKIHNHKHFTAWEIQMLVKILSLSNDEMMQYFFCEKC